MENRVKEKIKRGRRKPKGFLFFSCMSKRDIDQVLMMEMPTNYNPAGCNPDSPRSTLERKKRRAPVQIRPEQPENLLLNVLFHVNGLRFGGLFLGRYLAFRDAWAVAQTCKDAHRAFTKSATFIPTFVQTVFDLFEQSCNRCPSPLVSVKPTTGPQADAGPQDPLLVKSHATDERLDEYQQLSKLPLMAQQNYNAHRVAYGHFRGLSKTVKPDARYPSPTNPSFFRCWALTSLVDQMEEALAVFRQVQHRPLDPDTQKRLEDYLLTDAMIGTALLRWAIHRGDCSLESVRRQPTEIGIIRILLHTVDLRSSVWDGYLKDPRYQHYYKQAFCGLNRSDEDVDVDGMPNYQDFWLLVDAMCCTIGFGHQFRLATNQAMMEKYNRTLPTGGPPGFHVPLIRPRVATVGHYPASGLTTCLDLGLNETISPEGFYLFYLFHQRLATALERDRPIECLTFDQVGITDGARFEQFLLDHPKLNFGDGPAWQESYVEITTWDRSAGLSCALVVHTGIVPRPELVAVLERHLGTWFIFPAQPAWKQWWPIIQAHVK